MKKMKNSAASLSFFFSFLIFWFFWVFFLFIPNLTYIMYQPAGRAWLNP